MDDNNEARAKARELLKMLIKEQPTEEVWEKIFEHFCPAFEQRIREHYEKHGEWPFFYKNPGDWTVTSNLAMATVPWNSPT
jgi:hypothetical protein